MKLILKLLLLLCCTAYLVFAMTEFNKPDASALCREAEIVVADSIRAGFIQPHEVKSILQKAGLSPEGKELVGINTQAIENELRKNPFISSAECYKTPSGAVRIYITQLHPVMRVISDSGDDYFLTAEGQILPKMHYTAYLPVATGSISRKYAISHLTHVGGFLRDNAFWNDQIEQICVAADGTVELIMRVGSQVVYLGRPVSLEKKLDNLHALYAKVMNSVGWNKYSRISLEYDNQIICTKK